MKEELAEKLAEAEATAEEALLKADEAENIKASSKKCRSSFRRKRKTLRLSGIS